MGTDTSTNEAQAQHILENTLIRKIHPDWFNPDQMPLHRLGHTKQPTSVWLGPLKYPIHSLRDGLLDKRKED